MNTNVLAGFKCPKCGSEGPFLIATECLAEVWDEGIDLTAEHEWRDDSYCECKECHFKGAVEVFMTTCGYCWHWVRLSGDPNCGLTMVPCQRDHTCGAFYSLAKPRPAGWVMKKEGA